jgi:hypothetical protein|nr:MAG TPA: hypothetical protein [Caudoviricetes sp.]
MKNDDILNSGGSFTPEMEVETPTISKSEREQIEREQQEIRDLKIFRKSEAWQNAKKRLFEKLEKMKFEITETCDNNGSLENIGQNFKIYRICEQKVKELINEIEVEDERENE